VEKDWCVGGGAGKNIKNSFIVQTFINSCSWRFLGIYVERIENNK